jgi:hypothetical protein
MEILRKYGVGVTIYFPLIDAGEQDFESTPVTFASGDTQISKDGGAFANATNDPAHEGNGIYSLALEASEMEAAVVVVTIIDSATKAWEDQAVIISTYGNASAQHAFDLDTALTVAGIADQVWDELLAGHNGAGTTGDQLGQALTSVTGVADAVLQRDVAEVEGTASPDSLTSLILKNFHAAIHGTTLTVYKTDDETEFDTYTITKSSSADPITSIADPT